MSAPLQQLLAVSALIAACEMLRRRVSDLTPAESRSLDDMTARARRSFELSDIPHNDNVGASA